MGTETVRKGDGRLRREMIFECNFSLHGILCVIKNAVERNLIASLSNPTDTRAGRQ